MDTLGRFGGRHDDHRRACARTDRRPAPDGRTYHPTTGTGLLRLDMSVDTATASLWPGASNDRDREHTWTERWFHAIGSAAHVQVFGADRAILDQVVADLEAMEQCWTRFRLSSELTQLNHDPRREVEVSPLLAGALSRARLAWELTDGLFDPTVLDTLQTAGYDRPFPPPDRPLDARADLDDCRPSPGADSLEVDLERSVVRRPPGLQLDLGGIGKGLAADLTATSLVARGAIAACVSLGGDIRVHGTPPDGDWMIPVDHPQSSPLDGPGEPWFVARLTEGAIVTSTTRFRRWTTLTGDSAHHLIDPRSGRPADSGVDAVVVAASEAWWAEVLAKAALVAGPSDGQDLLERHGATGWFARPTVDERPSPHRP